MESIGEFISNYYIWFLTVSIILLFALIGYIYDTKKNENDLIKKSEDELEEMNLAELNNIENKSLNDMVSKSKNINPETKAIELTDEAILNENATPNTGDAPNNLPE